MTKLVESKHGLVSALWGILGVILGTQFGFLGMTGYVFLFLVYLARFIYHHGKEAGLAERK